jgi:hypothetical protein
VIGKNRDRSAVPIALALTAIVLTEKDLFGKSFERQCLSNNPPRLPFAATPYAEGTAVNTLFCVRIHDVQGFQTP